MEESEAKEIEDKIRQLDKILQYHRNLLQTANLLQAIGPASLEELTIKYLEELKTKLGEQLK